MEIGDKENRCIYCSSTQTYIRRITNERVCKKCGKVENLNEGNVNGVQID